MNIPTYFPPYVILKLNWLLEIFLQLSFLWTLCSNDFIVFVAFFSSSSFCAA